MVKFGPTALNFGMIQFNKIFIQLENQGIVNHYPPQISWRRAGLSMERRPYDNLTDES